MSICPHCNKDMGFSPWEDHVCGVIGYVKISTISHMATAHAADVVNQLVVAHVAV